MKKERIYFSLFIMPLFLFWPSFRFLKFEASKNNNPFLFEQKIQSLKDNKALHQSGSLSEHGQVQPGLGPLLAGEIKEVSLEDRQSQKLGKREPISFRGSGYRREKRQNPFLHGKQIQFLNQGKAFHSSGPRFRSDQVLVKFKSYLSEEMREASISAYNARKLKRIPGLDIYQLQIPENTTVEEMVYILRQNPDIDYAEPNYIISATMTPNDTLFRYQYALSNYGQEIGSEGPTGKPGADIKATAAWEETTGEKEIIIAIIDTGVDLDHPDIKNKIKSSGKDFVNGDNDATDDNGHGTHVAGIAAADTNNSEGIAGVCWNCKILPVKVLDANGIGDDVDVADGIVWAADNGADIINLSMGGDLPSSALEEALAYAYNKNIVIVASAGNDGLAVNYPAAYDDYCLAVAGTDYNDERVTFSNTGGEWESNYGPEIDVAAPGQYVLSLFPNELTQPGYLPYAWGNGTSASAPHVAGLAALIKGIKPNLTAAEIMGIIRYSTDDVNSASNPGRDDYLGYGRINMEKALVPIIVTPKEKK